MAAGPWILTDAARTRIWNRYVNGGSALTFKCALFLAASNLGAASTTYAGVTSEHANANGYTTGGITVTFTLTGTTSVAIKFAVDPEWLAVGGSITARKGAIYEVGGDVLAYCLLDATNIDVIATSGNTFTVDSDGTPEPVGTFA